jgi:hypothetical protein
VLDREGGGGVGGARGCREGIFTGQKRKVKIMIQKKEININNKPLLSPKMPINP